MWVRTDTPLSLVMNTRTGMFLPVGVSLCVCVWGCVEWGCVCEGVWSEGVCEGVWSEGVCEGVCISTSSFTSCVKRVLWCQKVRVQWPGFTSALMIYRTQLLHSIQHPHQLLVLALHSWPDGGLDLCLSDSELPKPDTILWHQWEHLLGNLVVWQGLCKWHTPPLKG